MNSVKYCFQTPKTRVNSDHFRLYLKTWPSELFPPIGEFFLDY